MLEIRLTYRALSDLGDIRDYSVLEYGDKAARAYISDIRDLLNTISAYPHILQERPFSEHLSFFPARGHVMIFSVLEDALYLLSLRHGRTDLQGFIQQFEPTLIKEAEVLHMRLKSKN